MYSGEYGVRHTEHAVDSFSLSTSRKARVDYYCSKLSCLAKVSYLRFLFVDAPNRFFAKTLSFATKLASNKMHVIILEASLPPVISFDPTRVKQVTLEAGVAVRAREGHFVSFNFSNVFLSREMFGGLKVAVPFVGGNAHFRFCTAAEHPPVGRFRDFHSRNFVLKPPRKNVTKVSKTAPPRASSETTTNSRCLPTSLRVVSWWT